MYEELKARLQAKKRNATEEEDDALEAIKQLERQLAERDAEIAKYRDAPVVWIHSDHLHQARNQPYLCRMSPVQREGYKPLIVKPGEQ